VRTHTNKTAPKVGIIYLVGGKLLIDSTPFAKAGGLVAIVIIGTGFGIFSWRRWTDLSRQVGEYKRLQTELSGLNREASLLSETDDLLQSCVSSEEAYNAIIRHIESQLPATSGAICAITQSRDLVEVVAR
jgi:hypothetical protein